MERKCNGQDLELVDWGCARRFDVADRGILRGGKRWDLLYIQELMKKKKSRFTTARRFTRILGMQQQYGPVIPSFQLRCWDTDI
jgi:hypothetical protein